MYDPIHGIYSADDSDRVLHHGACVGADEQFVDEVKKTVPYRIEAHPASNVRRDLISELALQLSDVVWANHPALKRNVEMVSLSDVLVACPAEFLEQRRSGTWATIRAARKACKPIAIVEPKGSLRWENR